MCSWKQEVVRALGPRMGRHSPLPAPLAHPEWLPSCLLMTLCVYRPALTAGRLGPLVVWISPSCYCWTWDEAVCGKSLKGEKVYSNDYNEQWAVKFKIPNRGISKKKKFQPLTVINAHIGKVYTHKYAFPTCSEGCIAGRKFTFSAMKKVSLEKTVKPPEYEVKPPKRGQLGTFVLYNLSKRLTIFNTTTVETSVNGHLYSETT